MSFETRAVHRRALMGVDKARRVLALIRGRTANQALDELRYKPPVLTRAEFDTVATASTEGGVRVRLHGGQFGPFDTSVRVLYGEPCDGDIEDIARDGEGELVHVRLSGELGARGEQGCDDGGVRRRCDTSTASPVRRTVTGGQPGDRKVVLCREGEAGEGPASTTLGEGR